MALGKKTGGRTKGTPNKEKAALRELVASKFHDWDPVIAMAEIATTTDDTAIKLQACKEVAQYIHPKLKSIEHKGDAPIPQVIVNLTPPHGDTERPAE